MWTTDTTSQAFLGMMAHWIEVVEGNWNLRSAVIVFRWVLGGHDGRNIGRYMIGLTDRVGITGRIFIKVRFTRMAHLINSDLIYTALLRDTR
jgi:hypothetical protein